MFILLTSIKPRLAHLLLSFQCKYLVKLSRRFSVLLMRSREMQTHATFDILLKLHNDQNEKIKMRKSTLG